MELDEIIPQECAAGNESAGLVPSCPPWDGSTIGDPGSGILPPPLPIDDRCSDPAFYDANPQICNGYPKLVLKPANALVEAGKTVDFSTYLRTNGNEIVLTAGLAYMAADPNIAVIEASGGIASGIQQGVTTISVKWQNLTAYAQVQVVDTCADVLNKYFILIDNSLSSTVGFGSLYTSRLGFSKEAARQFVNTVNLAKDSVSVGFFNTDGTVVLNASADVTAIQAAIAGIVGTTAKTNLHDGLAKATAYLNTLGGRPVLIFFSDGENNQGDDPIALANDWKAGGGVLITVALRAWGTFFDTLYKIASNGFFLSAYEATQSVVISTLQGLKTYLCSSDCHPPPGTYPTAQLNYTGFINWDVTAKRVDLCGLGVFDLLPGNGLYVDMSGTALAGEAPSEAEPGQLTSKSTFSFLAGHTYRLSIDVAGNMRNPGEINPVRVHIGALIDQTITPTDWNQKFVTSHFDFTPGAAGPFPIVIEALATTTPNNYGAFIDNVSLTDTTSSTVLLADNFDSENPITIDPSLTYYGPCLVTPPGAQQADPTPPTPPIEN